MTKTLEVIAVDFDNSEIGILPLTQGQEDVTCESATSFYQALKAQMLTLANVDDVTLLHYDRKTGDECLIVRNACCTGVNCSMRLPSAEGSYSGPTLNQVNERLTAQRSYNNTYLLVVEKDAMREQPVQILINKLPSLGYKVTTWEAVSTQRPKSVLA